MEYFFFFQAEDGIRDRNVTGVQTCALPICERLNFKKESVISFHALIGAVLGYVFLDKSKSFGDETEDESNRNYHEKIGRASCRERVKIKEREVDNKTKRQRNCHDHNSLNSK